MLGLAAIIGALITVWTFGSWVEGKYASWREGRPEAQYERLSRLRANVQLDSISSRLEEPPEICDQLGRHRSCTYAKSNYYVQVMVDKNNKVLSFAVTARTRDFHPVFWADGFRIVLGETTLAEAMPYPDFIEGGVGAGRFTYVEGGGGSHVANFQYYLVGINNAGDISRGSPGIEIDSLIGKYPKMNGRVELNVDVHDFLEERAVQEFRDQPVVNTFAMTAPFVDPSSLEQIGVDDISVYTLGGRCSLTSCRSSAR